MCTSVCIDLRFRKAIKAGLMFVRTSAFVQATGPDEADWCYPGEAQMKIAVNIEKLI